MHFSAFEAIVAGHGVLPRLPPVALLVLPVVEVVLGVGLLATFDMTLAWRCLMPLVSAVLIVAFSVYLAAVPSSVIVRTGCGCHGSPTSGLSMPSKSLALAANTGLLLLHLPVGVLSLPRKNSSSR